MHFQVTTAQLWRGLDYFDLAGELSCEARQYLVDQLHEKFNLAEKIFGVNKDDQTGTYYVFVRHGDLVRNGINARGVQLTINVIAVPILTPHEN